jgi:hypothetical protein
VVTPWSAPRRWMTCVYIGCCDKALVRCRTVGMSA